jgi:hypothetical protein
VTTVSLPPAAATSPRAPSTGWLYRPSVDLLLGAGLGYLLSLPILLFVSGALGVSDWPVAIAALVGLLVSAPHYGATLLRVYERREDRRRYAVFAVWVTLALGALFVVALHDPTTGSLLVTAYASWSPWHFSGQNYGLALMFLRRRGIPVEPRAKRLVYASFALAFALAFLVLHAERSSVAFASVPISDGSVFRFLSLGIPTPALEVLAAITGLAYLATTAGAAILLLRVAGPRDLVPAASLVLTQALWFAVPSALLAAAQSPLAGLASTFVWVSAAHGVQYLWVTSYFARRDDPTRRLTPYLASALCAGWAVTVAPALVFAPGLLGTLPWDKGLAIVLFSVVNLHHFVLDGAVWKLRDGRVARALLRDAPAEPESSGVPRRRAWARPALAAIGLASLGVGALDVWEREFVINRAGTDMERVLAGARVLAWIGRDDPSLHSRVAGYFASTGRPDDAIAEYRRSLDLYPTPEAWIGLGEVHGRAGRWPEATEAFAAAVALDPGHGIALVRLAQAWEQRGRADLAEPLLERAQTALPDSPEIGRALRRLGAAREAGP